MKHWFPRRCLGPLAVGLTLLMSSGVGFASPADVQFVGDAQAARASDPDQAAAQATYNTFRNWSAPTTSAHDPETNHTGGTIALTKANIPFYRQKILDLQDPTKSPPDVVAAVKALLAKAAPGSPNAAALGDLSPLELLALMKYYFHDNETVIPPKNTIQIVDSSKLAAQVAANPAVKDTVIAYETITTKKITHNLTPVYTTIWTYFPS